ncbi:MAG: hypothetical protein M3O91_07495 [Chloroflexota bacterium]|nr:hypothetical protein [Chloroflexota bacterium]
MIFSVSNYVMNTTNTTYTTNTTLGYVRIMFGPPPPDEPDAGVAAKPKTPRGGWPGAAVVDTVALPVDRDALPARAGAR